MLRVCRAGSRGAEALCRGAGGLARRPGRPPSSRRAPPPDSRRFRLGLLGESSALWLGKDDGRRRAPAGTVGCSQSSPLEVLRAEPGSSRYWAQRHFRFISAPPPEPVAERGIAVVRTDGNPSYGDRGRWLVPDSERSMAGPPHRGSRAPRLPSAFLGPRGEREEGAVGQEVGPFALPIAVLPVPPLCPCRAGPRERTECRSLDSMWRGGQGGRAEWPCKGRGRSGGRREGPARPRGRCCAVPAPPGPRAGGSCGRPGLRRRQCPRGGAVQRRRRPDGLGEWSRLRPGGEAAGSGPAAMEPGPTGETGALACGIRSAPDPASWQCGLQPPP